MNADKARKLIRVLSVLTLILSLALGGGLIVYALLTLCTLTTVIVLYRHLPELSNLAPESPKTKTLRLATGMSIVLVAGFALLATFDELGVYALSDQSAERLVPVLFGALIIGFGNIAPKLPFNRYTGLRLPWTVSDEETWIVAHRILGWLSLPCGLLCLAGLANAQNPAAIPVAMLLVWIAVPAALSGLFFHRKYCG